MKFIFMLSLVLSCSAFAQVTDRDVVRKAREVTRSLSANKGQLTRQERRKVIRLLNRVLDISEGGGIVDPQPPTPPISRAYYVGHCEIDDDLNFDPGQDVIGSVRGNQVMDLLTECAAIADSRYGDQGSFKVSRIELRGRISQDLYQSECHVDDDLEFDANQDVMGTLVGRSLVAIAQECRALGQFMHRNSSFKLLKSQGPTGRYRAQGVCHIDDDLQHDMNQDVFPMVGSSRLEIERSCQALALELYSNRSTYKVVY